MRSDDKRAVHAAVGRGGRDLLHRRAAPLRAGAGRQRGAAGRAGQVGRGPLPRPSTSTRALERNDTKAKGELETIAALFSADVIVPEALEGTTGQSLLEELVDELPQARGGRVEGAAQRHPRVDRAAGQRGHRPARRPGPGQQPEARTPAPTSTPTELTRQCLRYLFRLLVLLYAESRPELGILPADDAAYVEGYSLDRLRELCADGARRRHGPQRQPSAPVARPAVRAGQRRLPRRAGRAAAGCSTTIADAESAERSAEDYLQFPGLHAELFDPGSTSLLNQVTLRNEALQQVLRQADAGPGRRRQGRGRVHLLRPARHQPARRGLRGADGLHRVLRRPRTCTRWPRAATRPTAPGCCRSTTPTTTPTTCSSPAPTRSPATTGAGPAPEGQLRVPPVGPRPAAQRQLLHARGAHPLRGASTPWPSCWAPTTTPASPAAAPASPRPPRSWTSPSASRRWARGRSSTRRSTSSSAEYLKRRQAELGETLDADRYQRELQKVKAHFALHQSYGVDLNATAVELAEVSLWLNCMYPGLKAPWFGLQLRRGNSLIGCRRATWRVSQLGDRPWAETTEGQGPAAGRPQAVRRPARRRRDPPLPPARPRLGCGRRPQGGQGAARPTRPKALQEWRKAIQKAPDEDRRRAADRAGRGRRAAVGERGRVDRRHPAAAAPADRRLRRRAERRRRCGAQPSRGRSAAATTPTRRSAGSAR